MKPSITAAAEESTLRTSIDTLTRAAADFQRERNARAEAAALELIGEAHYYLGELPEAIAATRRAATLRQSVGDRRGEVAAINGMRWYAQSLGDFQLMLELGREALTLYRALGEPDGIANGLMGVANAHKALNDPRQAARLFDEADAMSSSPTRPVVSLHQGADQYVVAGDLRTAARRYDLAATLSRNRNRETEEIVSVGEASWIYAALGDTTVAQERLERVQRFWAARKDMLNAATRVTVLRLLGVAHARLGARERGIAYLDEAFAAVPPTLPASADWYRDLALAYAQLGQKERGIECYDGAIPIVRDILRNPLREARLRAFRAGLERDVGRLEAARADIEAALPVFESVRGSLAAPGIRSTYFSTIERHYDLYIDILMRLGGANVATAFEASERARGRGLLELLNEAGVDLRQGVDRSLLDRQDAVRRQLDRLSARQQVATVGASGPDSAGLRQAIEAASRDYEIIQGQIRRVSPQYAALTQPSSRSLSDVQRELLDDDTVLLEYALGLGPFDGSPRAAALDHAGSYLFVVSRDAITGVTLSSREEIDAAARRYFRAVSSRPPRALAGGADREYQAAARELSRLVLRPAASLLGRKRLIVVAQGALQYVPFAALPDPRASAAELLVRGHEIVYAPSASVLARLRSEATAPRRATSVAVFADPVFGGDDPRVGVSPAIRPQNDELDRAATEAGLAGPLSRLPFTLAEAQAIARSARADEVHAAVGFDADKAAVTGDKLRRYRVVHFATHALIDSVNPVLSGIVLSLIDERGAPRDGFVRLNDIYNMRLSADLVVLSGCQTALGQDVRGDGLVGLTRGFLYAGADSVAASLWKIDDRGTSALMSAFYADLLKRRMRPAAALRAAQDALSRDPRWSHPYYWAPFQLVGEWQ